MSIMDHRGRVRALAGVALAVLLSACVTNIQGSRTPPVDWVADAPSIQCIALSGSYLAAGTPSPANATAGNYGAVWPTEGSLISIIERGTNAPPRKAFRPDPSVDPVDVVPAIRFIVDASGSVEFEAKTALGETERLRPRAWTCESGTLTSLVSLNTPNFESHTRLWKHDDDLIAEQTIREAHDKGSRAHRPVARFHFRFLSTMD